MARNLLGVIAGLVFWFAVAAVAGAILRAMWPAYVSVAEAMAFTLPMLLARLAIGVFATIAMGFVAARIAQSTVARLIPGIVLVLMFIPQHVMLWEKFPVWYHLWFLLTLVPLTYVGNSLAGSVVKASPATRQA